MKKRVIEGIEVYRGSGNVFADLDLPDADTLQIKAGLVIEIRRAIRQQGLTQQAAVTRMGLTQPKVSSMMRGDFSNVPERKLMECLNRLGYDIEIKVRSASAHRTFDAGTTVMTERSLAKVITLLEKNRTFPLIPESNSPPLLSFLHETKDSAHHNPSGQGAGCRNYGA